VRNQEVSLELRCLELDGKSSRLEECRAELKAVESKLSKYNEAAKQQEVALRARELKQDEREKLHVL